MRALGIFGVLLGLLFAATDSSYGQSQRSRAKRTQTPKPRSTADSTVAARPRRGAPQAGEKVKEEIVSEVISQVVAGGLKNPCGVAVQPRRIRCSSPIVVPGESCG